MGDQPDERFLPIVFPIIGHADSKKVPFRVFRVPLSQSQGKAFTHQRVCDICLAIILRPSLNDKRYNSIQTPHLNEGLYFVTHPIGLCRIRRTYYNKALGRLQMASQFVIEYAGSKCVTITENRSDIARV